MATIQDIRNKLKDRRLSIVAKETGLTRQAIYKILNGETQNPTYETMSKLIKYFEENQ